MRIFPDCPVVIRYVELGGLTKGELIQKLQQNSIMMNEYGDKLLSDDRFTTSETIYTLKTVELTIRDLGFPEGATLPRIFKRSSELGLELCPLELAPYLRLEYLDQPEGNLEKQSRQHQAPTGSITIASEIVSKDDEFPKGFYLRNINGVLWLRGYIADDQHVWSPNDRFIFCQTKE